MPPLVYSMQFRGQTRDAAAAASGVAMTAPSCSFLATIDGAGLHSGIAVVAGEDAVFRCELRLERATGGEHATVLCGSGHALHLRSVGAAAIEPSPDPHLRHGTLMWRVEAGEGQFADAAGRVTSNFVLSDTGELTDNQLGVLFLRPDPQPPAPACKARPAASPASD
jgi:hypothetical protein